MTFRLEMIRQDELKTITVSAERPFGLNISGAQIEADLLDIDVCERDSVEDEFACANAEALNVVQGEHFTGEVTVGDGESGEGFIDHVRSNREAFRIFYDLPFYPTGLTYDRDANGLPVGLEIDWKLPINIQIGNGRLTFRLLEYDPESGGDKANNKPTATFMHFWIGFNLLG